jgi:Tol biopolymer transport system component
MRSSLPLTLALCLTLSAGAAAQEWNIETSRAPATTRLDFVATEGTWISLDVSPDGRFIVFDLLGHLYEMPIDGGEARPLTTGRSWNMFPRYSPDGKSILFTSDRAGIEDQWTLDRASNGLTNLTKSARSIYQGSWSADGRLFYASSVEDAQRIRIYQFGLHGSRQDLVRTGVFQPAIHVVDDTLRNRLLYEHNEGNLPASGARIKSYDKATGEISIYIDRPGGAANPALSPDGKTLAYVHRDYQVTTLIAHDLETRRERVLVTGLDRDRQDYKVYHHGSYPNMDWHPNGREVILSYGGQIRAVNAVTGAARTIPFRARVDRVLDQTIRFPAREPQGEVRTRTHRWAQRIAGGILYETLGDLYLKAPNGTRRVTETSAHETSPVFDPATGTIYYATWSDDSLGAIESRALAGGAPTRLTTVPTQYGSLALSPDGKTLAALRGRPTFHGGDRLGDQREFELILIGPDRREQVVTRVSWIANYAVNYPPGITFGPRGELYFSEFQGDTLLLKRVRPDGLGETVLHRFPHAVRVEVSPDAKWIAFEEYFRSYLAPLEFVGQATTMSPADRQGTFWRVRPEDGHLAWSRDGATITWVSGSSFLERPVGDVATGRDQPPVRTDLSVGFPVAIPASTIALTGLRVITMDSARRVLDNATILIRRNRIEAVGRGVAIPAGAHRVDLAGHTVMPGIVDVHAHFGGLDHSVLNVIEQRLPGLHAALAHGVTTMYEVYGNVDKDYWVGDLIRKGEMVGPRIYSTGQGIYGSRFFRPKQYRYLEDLEGVREAVTHNKDRGATAVKDYLTPHRRARHQIATVARELGLNVEVEPGGEAQTNLTRLIDGATGIAHGMGFTPIYSDIIKMYAATEVGVTPTLIVTLDGPQGESFFYESERVWENQKLLRFTTREALVARSRAPHYWPEDQFAPRLAAIMKKLHDAGVSVQLGAHGQQLGLDAHWEMELFAQGGFTPMEVIQIATINGARHAGLDQDVGSIQVGKLADLVVMSRNPLENIKNARAIAFVVQNGVLYRGDDLARVHPDPAPAKRMYFQSP